MGEMLFTSPASLRYVRTRPRATLEKRCSAGCGGSTHEQRAQSCRMTGLRTRLHSPGDGFESTRTLSRLSAVPSGRAGTMTCLRLRSITSASLGPVAVSSCAFSGRSDGFTSPNSGWTNMFHPAAPKTLCKLGLSQQRAPVHTWSAKLFLAQYPKADNLRHCFGQLWTLVSVK